mgnify:CR=1 FL=1
MNETAITAWETNCPKPGGAAMIPRRNRDLPFGRNSFSFSYKRRYNGNLCVCSVQQAKAAASMMTCTLSAPAAYFLSTTVLCARNVSPTAYFLPTAAKSFHRRVNRFPATLWRENRDTSSKPPRFIRHRRRFGGFRQRPMVSGLLYLQEPCLLWDVVGIDSATDPLPLPLS